MLTVGSGNSGIGGDLSLRAGASTAASKDGGSIYIYPGTGTTSTSGVYIYDGAGSQRILVTSSTIKLDSGGTVDIDAASSVTIDAATTITLSATSGVDFADSSIIVGYATGTGTAVTMNTVSGLITSSSSALGASTSETYTLTNSKITATTSLVIVNVVSQCTIGRVIVSNAAVGSVGSATITVYNDGSTCGSTYTLGFLVLNN
jgi:hypothetical protein